MGRIKYQNPQIEPNLETVIRYYGSYEEFKRFHPDYHLYADLVERLPQYVRIIETLSKIKELPLNEKGLPF